jgi:hemerythrin-like metal-binding protein
MPYFLWTDDVITGSKMVDAEHRKITMLVDTLLASCESGASTETVSFQLEEIAIASDRHFEWENFEMLSIGYRDRDMHIADHAMLLEDISTLAKEIKNTHQYSAQDVYHFFKAWLHDHIFIYDIPMVNALQIFTGYDE